jgi:hypothetical protein
MRSSRILHSIYGCLTHAYSPYFVSMFSILFSQFRHQCPAWNVNCMRILKRFESFHWITFHQPSWTHFTHWIIHLIYQHFRYQDVVVFSVWEKKETNSRRKSEGAKWRDAGWESPRKTENSTVGIFDFYCAHFLWTEITRRYTCGVLRFCSKARGNWKVFEWHAV